MSELFMFSCNSTEPWRPLGHILDLYVLPIICLCGLVLNIACLVVFTKRRSHPIVPALIVLSICDSLQLLFSLFVLYLPALHDHLELHPLGFVAQVAYIATGTLAGGLLASNCASIWTMCYISIQRHRAIVKPLSTVKGSDTPACVPLCAIATAALLFNMPVWFEFTWSLDEVDLGNGTAAWIIWHSNSQLAHNATYRFVMHKVLYPIVVYLIPLILISVLNLRMLSYIASSRVQSVGHKRRMAKERRSVMLLIAIVLTFFTCHTGGLVIRFVDHEAYGNMPCFVFSKDFVNFLFNINSFSNPMLYFFFTKQFKDLRTSWTSSHTGSVSQRLVAKTSTKPLVPQESPIIVKKPPKSPLYWFRCCSEQHCEYNAGYVTARWSISETSTKQGTSM